MERRDERFLGASIDTEWEGMAGRVHTSSRRVYAIFQRAVCLHHPVYGVAYEGFELGDLVQGSKVHVSLRPLPGNARQCMLMVDSSILRP